MRFLSNCNLSESMHRRQTYYHLLRALQDNPETSSLVRSVRATLSYPKSSLVDSSIRYSREEVLRLLEPLKHLKSLELLFGPNPRICWSAVSDILCELRLPQLEVLRIECFQTSNGHRQDMQRIPSHFNQLHTLELTCCALSARQLRAILLKTPALQSLAIVYSSVVDDPNHYEPGFYDTALRSIGSSMQELKIWATASASWSATSGPAAVFLPHMPNLHHLNIEPDELLHHPEFVHQIPLTLQHVGFHLTVHEVDGVFFHGPTRRAIDSVVHDARFKQLTRVTGYVLEEVVVDKGSYWPPRTDLRCDLVVVAGEIGRSTPFVLWDLTV